ncbi:MULTISPECIES: ROK family transcriptional regulator [Actinotignum]|uniref:ROK family protein n=1 Tax=Actinotignum timonense TaxID=1870995 RepID=A0AAW9HCN0_9ACTO|nr:MULTISPECIES: ROK family protein [Actinotignum]MDE1558546.1 ROK family protein [Actinotignum schaalii]MDE1663402.1 ROK family protein [Actinotignum schaalii]MDK6372710.1 ROK family protein [Actinotignum timonense]MDK6419796.1 ROK family protein [Actinotignum timonense]MDK6589437.1 ROK family protein [Actinotignum timonense]
MSNVSKFPAAVTRRVQRRMNLLAACQYLVRESQTIAEIAGKIGVTRPAAESIVADLDDLGWLKQLEPENTLGRPAVRWVLDEQAVYVLGLDIGAHHCTAMLCNARGEVLAERTCELSAAQVANERIDAAVDLGRSTLADAKLDVRDITLCSVASPGVINDGAVEYFGGSGMPGWQGSDIAAQISSRLGCHTVVAGDCALGALGEAWQGAAEGHDEVLYILSGERTGAAAIVGGRIHRGLRGGAGLIGELGVLRWRDIEAATHARELYPEGDVPSRTKIFESVDSDPRARDFVDDFADALSLGASAMILALAPSHVVVGGKYSAYADTFLERFIENLRRICPIMPEVSVSALGPRAICLGALRQGLDTLTDDLTQMASSSEVFPSVQGFQEIYRR